MAHDHHHEEKTSLSFFASPLQTHSPTPHYEHNEPPSTYSGDDVEHQKDMRTTTSVPFANTDADIHNTPAFHRHAEATTAELFYDLFFVANLTTFTSVLEINDRNSLTAYIGFFSLLWLTWYQVSLYDVRFSSDSVFERVAKAIHFGVMVGFAVIGPQWKPGQDVEDYKIYKAFGLILMVSRITLFAQYSVTLLYAKKYTKTIVPLCMIMGSTLLAALLYGAITPAFPDTKLDIDEFLVPQKSNAYIAWYIIALCETVLTVGVSCFFRVISFKGTHMVQRMSLLTLIILGEGIIVICKSISKIVKNDYLWTASVVGQIIAATLIIYFLYMLYFDRMQEEHFGSIKQQIWSFSHFPLHTAVVLVLQGISLLIIWTQAAQAIDLLATSFDTALAIDYPNGTAFADTMANIADSQVFLSVPKGVDASEERDQARTALFALVDSYDYYLIDHNNETAKIEAWDGVNELFTACAKTLFDSLGVSIPKKKTDQDKAKTADIETQMKQYMDVFQLVFTYVFIAGGLALIITTTLGWLSLPASQKKTSQYIRLGINFVFGIGLCLISTINYNDTRKKNYMWSPWMIPTICILVSGSLCSLSSRLIGVVFRVCHRQPHFTAEEEGPLIRECIVMNGSGFGLRYLLQMMIDSMFTHMIGHWLWRAKRILTGNVLFLIR
jgi:low temperature requirement protein LtrA